MNHVNTPACRQAGNNQSGVTLLLALLVLSGLTLVTVAVSTLTIQEIRSSRAVVVAEPALNAAESGAEQGLWAVKTGGTVPNCHISSANPPTSNNTYVSYCKRYEGGLVNVLSGTPAIIYLYNPNDPAGDIDLSDYPYTRLVITNQSGGNNITVTVTRLDGTDMGINDVPVGPGGTEIITISPVVTDTEGRMIITITSVDTNAVYLTTYNDNLSPAVETGLPTNLTLSSTACSSKSIVTGCTNVNQELYTRRIEVDIPQ